jgi:hypothetical protein
MFKKILVLGLLAVVIVATAFSIYNNTLAAQAEPETAAALDTAAASAVAAPGNGQGAQARGGQGAGTGIAFDAQANLDTTVAGAGPGNGQAQSRGSQGGGTGVPAPQNGLTEWVTYSGEVMAYTAPTFTLVTDSGETISAELGNISYVEQLGLVLQVGDQVSVTGFWDVNGGLALKSLTLDATGQTFALRDDLGRPLWAGGKGQGGH